MKNKLFLTFVAFATLFTACKKDNADQVSLNQETISATLPESGSRTTLNGAQVLWSAGDAISVFASNWNEYSNNKGTLISGAGTTSANFSLILEGTEKVATVYPYQATATFDGSVVALTMPDVYDYADSDISGAPMAALFTNNSSNVTFKNAGALLAVTVNNIPAGYNKAILTATGASIAGDCQINFDNDGVPTLTAVSGEEQIAINFDAANEPNKTFYFPLPVANYPELVFSISNGTETMVLKTKALNAERNMSYKSVITLDTVVGETSPYDTAIVSSPAELAAAVANPNVSVIKFADDITVEQTVNITRDLTVDLNGNNLNGSVYMGRMFELAEDGVNFTLNAETTGTEPNVTFGKDDEGNYVKTYGIVELRAVNNATVTINGGIFEGETYTGTLVRFRSGDNNTVTLNNVNYTETSQLQNGDQNAFVVCGDLGTPNNKLIVNGGVYNSPTGFKACFNSVFDNVEIKAQHLGVELTSSVRDNDNTNNAEHWLRDCTISIASGQTVYKAHGACVAASRAATVNIVGGNITCDPSITDAEPNAGALRVYNSGGIIYYNSGAVVTGNKRADVLTSNEEEGVVLDPTLVSSKIEQKDDLVWPW